jgi:DNA mismatch endonuclease (patch repair protein)
MPDRLTPEMRSRLMSRVKSRDTKPEVALRQALWAAGVRGWRLHAKQVPGRPDVAWIGLRVACFVDGKFWHGHPDHYWGQSGPFWDKKIARNRARDGRINVELAEQGWRVVRLWDFEVDQRLDTCVGLIEHVLADARRARQADAGEDERMCVFRPTSDVHSSTR